MAKDYFQDIKLSSDGDSSVKPKPSAARRPSPRPLVEKPLREAPQRIAVRNDDAEPDVDQEGDDDLVEQQPTSRGIRNISLPARATRSRNDMGESRSSGGMTPPLPPRRPIFPASGIPSGSRKASRKWLWIVVVICLVVLAGASVFLFRPTTVTVTPRSHTVTFDGTSQFTAYPADNAATSTLPYTVLTQTFTASQSVPASGTQEVQEKASGTITVYNNYSSTPQKLIANTRFQTPDGLIFRIANAISIPGKSGSTPGQITTNVVADQTGPSYNIGPVAKFTVPGLQSTSAQYAGIYAVSTAPMTGGFSGQKPGVSATDEANAVTALQAQLAQKIAQFAEQNTSATTTALGGLALITYQEMPETSGDNNTAQINESAQVQLPVFPASLFANAIAQTVSADVNGSSVSLIPGNGFSAIAQNATTTSLGTDPLNFTLAGVAQIVWQVDSTSLAQALAGKSQSAFTTIVNGFPGIQQASARVEPFWKSTFPTDPTKIKIVVEAPQSSSS